MSRVLVLGVGLVQGAPTLTRGHGFEIELYVLLAMFHLCDKNVNDMQRICKRRVASCGH